MNGSEIAAIVILVFLAIGAIYFIVELIKKYLSIEKPEDNKKQYSEKHEKNKKPPVKDYSGLNKEIEEVVRLVGVSEHIITDKMFLKVDGKKEKEVIDEIAKQLDLPMKITTKYAAEKKYNDDGSSPLAEVTVGNIPRYGSEKLKDYPCTITLYPGYNSSPNRFIYVIAHELCHYVLQAIRPRLPDNEKEERLTDLAVIFSGFDSVYGTAWQSNVNGNAGYILDEYDITYVRRRYESMLAERRQKCERVSTEYKKTLSENKDVLLFIEMCKKFFDHPNEKYLEDDNEAIQKCLQAVTPKDIQKVERLRKSLDHIKNTTRYGATVEESDETLSELIKIIKGIVLPENADITTLAKYVSNY